MTSLLEEIRSISEDAARALESAGYSTDPEIKTLNRTDLNELLPGAEKLYERKKVFEKIQNTTKEPIEDILNELRSFIPDEVFRDALTGNGAPVDYLNTLKELKGYGIKIQTFIDAHINLLEGIHENQGQKPIKDHGASSQFGSETASTSHPQQTHETGIPDNTHQTGGNVRTYTLVTVMNKTIVTGKTLNAHQHVLNKVEKHFVQSKDSFQLHLEEKENADHCNIIIVFCPVVSRVGTDVDSAMSQVPNGKDVILVLMHHTREAKASWNLRTWSRPKHVVLDVNVFFHDAMGGLLNCKENDDAVSEIQRKLLEYSSHTEKRVSQNPSSKSKWFFR